MRKISLLLFALTLMVEACNNETSTEAKTDSTATKTDSATKSEETKMANDSTRMSVDSATSGEPNATRPGTGGVKRQKTSIEVNKDSLNKILKK